MKKNNSKPHALKCGAKTRSGNSCNNYAMANGRCRMHGGKSTGPKDRAKQSESQKRNNNRETHGLFSKYLPNETMDLVNSIESLNSIDILWTNIKIQYAAIVRSQSIMYVEDNNDKDIDVIESGEFSEKVQVITAGDKQSNFLQSQSRAMNTLSKMIRDYEELCRSELATEQQRLRIEKLKVDIDKVKDEDVDKPIAIRLVSKGEPSER